MISQSRAPVSSIIYLNDTFEHDYSSSILVQPISLPPYASTVILISFIVLALLIIYFLYKNYWLYRK